MAPTLHHSSKVSISPNPKSRINVTTGNNKQSSEKLYPLIKSVVTDLKQWRKDLTLFEERKKLFHYYPCPNCHLDYREAQWDHTFELCKPCADKHANTILDSLSQKK